MNTEQLAVKARAYLERLCVELPGRHVGGPGNRAATDLYAQTLEAHGFQIEITDFDCMDWTSEGVSLVVDGPDAPVAPAASFRASASPYAPGCRVRAPLVTVSTVKELEAADLSGRVLLLRGDITQEQLTPKSFPFYSSDRHSHIISLLESRNPAAIIAATSRDTEMAGAVYPFPLIEDGDFDIPSVFMTDEEGERLARHAGQVLSLVSRATRIPSQACNVTARKDAGGQRRVGARRVVLCAHIDAKLGTPGAIDNAAGVATLLLLGELLAGHPGGRGVEVELVAINGEDYYSNPGEQHFLSANAGRFGTIALGVNLDGVGYREGKTVYSLYGCPPDIDGALREVFGRHPSLTEGEPWFQGDHALFVLNGTPALALTSERAGELMKKVVHTADDTPDLIDTTKLADLSLALRDLVLRL